MLFFTAANDSRSLSDPHLRRRRVSIRGLSPDDANAHDESDQKKKVQFGAKRRKLRRSCVTPR